MGESYLITEEELISQSELFKCWRGATQEQIWAVQSEKELTAYNYEKSVRKSPHRLIEIWLTPTYKSLPICSWDAETRTWSYDNRIVFLESNILEVERKHPDFLYERVPLVTNNPDNPQELDTDNANSDNGYVLQLQSELSASKNRLAELETENLELATVCLH